jgi:hypothetical protein
VNRQVVTYVVTVAFAIVLVVRGEDTRTDVKTIKRDTVTLTPCLRGNDKSCRAFLGRLLRAATPEQIRKLRGKPEFTTEEIRRIVREETEGGGAPSGQPGPPPGHPGPPP